jgi:mannose-6-phosphate isomerase-like protein (cupin superfamily)
MPPIQADQLTGLSVANLSGPITTYDQLGGGGMVLNKALAIPVHLGDPWNSVEYVLIPPAANGVVSSVGTHVQGTDEIYFMHRGMGILTTNGVECPVAAGFLAIAPRGTRHSIRNESRAGPLAFLVIELKTPEGGSTFQPTSFPSLLREASPSLDGFHPAMVGQHSVPLRVGCIDLRDYFSAPWGRLAVVEIPAGGRIEEYREEAHDENLLVLSGNATIEVAGERFDTEEDGLNVLVPGGVRHRIVNRSSVSPLTVLSVLVRSEGTRVAS